MKAYFATCLGVLLFSGPAGHAEAQSDTERLRPQWQALDAEGREVPRLARLAISLIRLWLLARFARLAVEGVSRAPRLMTT